MISCAALLSAVYILTDGYIIAQRKGHGLGKKRKLHVLPTFPDFSAPGFPSFSAPIAEKEGKPGLKNSGKREEQLC
jgi:hypothetical protein